MIKTIKIGFHDPYTGIWVEGKNKFYFTDETDIEETCARWLEALRYKYNDKTVEVKPCDFDWNKENNK